MTNFSDNIIFLDKDYKAQKMSFSESLSINIILAFESISTGLYTWKFKGKQLLTDLINCLTQYRIILSPKLLNSQIPTEVNLYSNAKQKCLKEALRMLVLFQTHLEKYSQALKNIEKLQKQSQLQKDFLGRKLQDYKGTQKQKEYDFLIAQLLQLTLQLCGQYLSQYQLIELSRNQIIKNLLNSNSNKAQYLGQFSGDNFFSLTIDTLNWGINYLQMLLMNIQYQTQINSENRDRFIESLSKISNKRGQLNK